jgi:two-component system cell cycle sensor histidine kinase/response regulator CckA
VKPLGARVKGEPMVEHIDNEHLLELLAASPTVIFTARPGGDFGATSISENITAQMGHAQADFLDDPSFWADQIHPDDLERTFAGMDALFEDGFKALEYRFRHKDGSYRWMYDQLRLLYDEQGEPFEIVGYWIDITERKHLEQDLLAAAARYRSLFETVPYGIEEIDCSGIILVANAAHHKKYGYEDGEVIGRSILEFCPGGVERERQREYLEHLVRDRPARSPYYGRKVTKNGDEIDVEVAWNYNLDSNGELIGFTSLITDITERTAAEVSLRRSEERFELAVAAANEGLWDKNLQTRTAYWAPRLFVLIGYEVDEIEPSDASFRALLHPDDRTRIQAAMDDHLEGRTPKYEVEYRLRTKTGEYRWFRSRAGAIRDETGTAVRLIGFISDITDQRQLRATLRETQQILDSTPDPTVIVNYVGNIVFANSKATGFGYLREELLGKPITTLIPEFVRPESWTAVSADAIELSGRRSDGSEFPVEVSLSPIETDSETLVAAAIRDISDRKQLEASLQQAQKVESLGILAGGIAHDFNNLLMGVLGYADVALVKSRAGSPVGEELHNISSAAMRAADLTSQMLAYAGHGRFMVEALNLSQLVEEIGNLVEVSISTNVDLKYSFADELPTIEADASQIQQVIMNLIINASEAFEGRAGTITVSTSTIQVDRHYLAGAYLNDELPDGAYVCLEVTDDGCGMDAEAQRKIFDPFFTTKFTGRGLGLAAVLGIIRGHHGALKISSQPGVGSTFKVLFPAVTLVATAQVITRDRVDQWRGTGTILVVDDEEAVRLAAKAMIETCGLTVATADGGQAALDIIRDRGDEIVAVLLDLTMPHMDGEETFRELRRINPNVNVILSSGFDEQETTSRFAGSGLAGFIHKPYGLSELIAKLREVLDEP